MKSELRTWSGTSTVEKIKTNMESQDDAEQDKSFTGFTDSDVNTSMMNKRLWKVEAENTRLREEVRGLIDTVRQ